MAFAAVLQAATSAFVLFFGRRLLRTTVALGGALAGMLLGGAVGVFAGPVGVLVGAVVGLVVGVLLALLLLAVGVVLLGAVAGWFLAVALDAALGWSLMPWTGVLLAALGAAAVALWRDPALVGATSVAGAYGLVDAMRELLRGPADGWLEDGTVRLLVLLALAALGALVQGRALRRE